jgi:hypothetical protein
MTIINGTLLHGSKTEEQVFLILCFKVIQNIPEEVAVILPIKERKSFGGTGGTDL